MEKELKRAQAIINALVAQRNEALDRIVNMAAALEDVQEQLNELKKKEEPKQE